MSFFWPKNFELSSRIELTNMTLTSGLRSVIDIHLVLRDDPFITFAERGRGGGYPKANVVSEVA